MIFCVWYPSGGFGHFVNAVLTLRGKNFVRPSKSLEFSKNGNSHELDLVVPKYQYEQWPGGVEFADTKNYCVLVDNGIDNESMAFKATFPGAEIIKICYSDHTWPIVARTMIEKAMNRSIEQELPADQWQSQEPWAQREKYFLFLRDHAFRSAWKQQQEPALYVDQMLDYQSFFNALNTVVGVENFDDLWNQWRWANSAYIDPVQNAQNIMAALKQNQTVDLAHCKDTWSQAVVYYYIWLEFGFEVLHNDFPNFFDDTDQIRKMIQ